MAFLSENVVFQRMRAAQNIDFDLRDVCGQQVFQSVDAHSKAIGAPHPFIFFPLLTVIASCMGVKASFQVNTEWKEPSVLWTVVAARKGEKKTPACKRLTTAIAKLEEELQQEALHGNDSDDEDRPPKAVSPDKIPQLLVDYFSFEELYNLMNRSGRQILAVYDEVMVLYQQLDLYKPTGSKIDKTTLLSLFNGGSWNRNFKNNSASTTKMGNTAFNYTGFIQPKFLIEMLQRDDHDGFYDRLMVVCPAELLVPFRELQVPLPDDIVDFYEVFKSIRDLHVDSDEVVIYTFDEEALDQFATMHDNLHQQKAETDDENKRGHLIKAITHLVRLSGIIHVMEQAFNAIAANTPISSDSWSTIITLPSLERAWKIVSYVLTQKWALMPPSINIVDPESNDAFMEGNARKIRKILSRKDKDFPMTPSSAARNRLVPSGVDAKGNRIKCNADTASAFFDKLQDLHLGKHKKETAKNKKQTSRFTKRKYEDLDAIALGHLKKLKMNKKQYAGEARVDDSDSDSDIDYEPHAPKDTSVAGCSQTQEVQRAE